MNNLPSFLIILCLMVVTEGCMRTIPPDDVHIPAPDNEEELTTTPEIETSTVTEKVCFDTKNAECSETLESLYFGGDLGDDAIHYVFVKKDGCPVLQCPENEFPIPRVKDSTGATQFDLFYAAPPKTTEEFSMTTVTDFFGIICEDSKWKLTKLPHGIISQPENLYADGSLTGNKYDIFYINCGFLF
ncbi:Lipoprotein [Caenorhabditis elegans]|uniref:Lipoprotein n=1 Tax=Caenorhabditis elegans TaxID=6239 RepID=Q9N5F7_CAEEL|nr:Lipoprotein [Caenorhabditis elegans]CCD65487.1 Lipoprotein [Caenorhabditis elegans]|eukprot:NP_503757.2 Uncharacterized protein CELE_R05D8.11 [Caenorhabditis elegans]